MSYRPTCWLDYNDMHAIMCAGYYTSHCIQQTWKQAARCTSLHTPKYTPGHALKDSFNCTRWHTPSLLDCMLRNTLPGMLSRTLPIALDGTLPANLTVCSQVSSQDALMHTPEHALNSQLHSMTHSKPACLYTPKEALKTLPSTLRVRSQVHSRACSQRRS